ncbi:MAG: starch-binding protein [Methylococcaceae bacterium]|nr:starch-binding protein [Methylococcaceae bacterium]
MSTLTVHFERPADWADSVYIHFWDVEPSGAGSDWPGVRMAAEGTNSFFWRFEGSSAAHFVIHDGWGRQTADHYRRRDSWLDRRGHWHDSQPVASKASVPATTPKSSTSTGKSGVTRKTKSALRYVEAKNSRVENQPDFREETIYFLLTTRFYDGDPSNNFFCRDRIQFDASGQAVDQHWRGVF